MSMAVVLKYVVRATVVYPMLGTALPVMLTHSVALKGCSLTYVRG